MSGGGARGAAHPWVRAWEAEAAVDDVWHRAGGAEGAALSRRSFFKLLGTTAMLAGLDACMRAPAEKILPYAVQPPEVTPGVPLHYATSMTIDGYATGLLVESHEGRPTKVEGNPDHPASLGAAGVYEQASVLQLYDPYRARAPRAGRGRGTWAQFAQTFGAPLGGARGAGLALLLEPASSPLVAALLARVRARYPEAGVYFHAPLESRAPLDAARAVLGAPLIAQHDLRRAEVVLALDADVLGSGPFHLRYARHFADGRRVETPAATMNRLYVAESMVSPTGSIADHRLRLRAGDVARLAAVITDRIAQRADVTPGLVSTDVAQALARVSLPREQMRWAAAVADDLVAHRGRSVVIAGEAQPPVVHALAFLLNALLGAAGSTVWYTDSPVLEAGAASHDLRPLVDAMRAGTVETLVIAESNPVYTAPAELAFRDALGRVRRTAYLGLYENETARACEWLVPSAHYLEAWGDTRAYDGTLSLVQPLITPLYGGKTVSELLSVLAGGGDQSAHALLRDAWRAQRGGAGTSADAAWEDALRRGVVDGTALPPVTPKPSWGALAPMLAPLAAPLAEHGIEVIFTRDPRVYDGRFADNAWLQELPEPITTITWGNAALLAPGTARRLGVATGDVVAIHVGAGSVQLPVVIVPGHADDSITTRIGYGREGAELVAHGIGVNVLPLRTNDAPYLAPATRVERVRDADGAPVRYALATTQAHWQLEGRPIVHETTLDAYRRAPDFTASQRGRVLSLYEPHRYDSGDQWAMVIDLGTCIGCGACAVACQAENNVPVVGPQGVRDRREMHWLRIDRYLAGAEDDPRIVHQPMLCQQCEKAPCEYVCPVHATVHSDDGLNEMVYNRCVGTRFCSNNCPYKVRRFNWFHYTAHLPEPEPMVENPDVTVRARGVMEKCTFCVQRIRRAQIDAQIAGRPVRDGEVVTACQQACPTQAIVFGSYTDRSSAVSRQLTQRRRYVVLHDLGTEPRVRYLARITNPNPALEGDA